MAAIGRLRLHRRQVADVVVELGTIGGRRYADAAGHLEQAITELDQALTCLGGSSACVDE